jgi:2-keto-4-pentenoate hydratase/2-oxohepta-3-ene-1,7-dioic acid hydratase in catechol pathway
MKLLRYGEIGHEKPAMVDAEGGLRDLSVLIDDIGPEQLSRESLDRLAKSDGEELPLIGGSPRIGACVNRPSKILAIGLNYRRHAAEANMLLPIEPVLFMKATTSLAGPNDPIILPRGGDRGDWEVELGVVIGRKAQYVSEAEAPNFIAGYCTANDVSDRAFQFERQGQWVKGKSCDSFGPIGPYLVTTDEVRDPQKLRLFCEVNGKVVQDSSTSDMVFNVFHIVSYVSHFMTLLPGDVIMTGTPEGVALGMKPLVYLKTGDTVRCGVEGLGDQLHKVASCA